MLGWKWAPAEEASLEGESGDGEVEVIAEMKERVWVVAEAWRAVVEGVVSGMMDGVGEEVVGKVEKGWRYVGAEQMH